MNPRTNDEAWVVNQISNSVSVTSLSKGIVTDTIAVKPGIGRDMKAGEPMDVVFAGSNQAYVSVSRANTIVVLDTLTHQTVATIPVFGGNRAPWLQVPTATPSTRHLLWQETPPRLFPPNWLPRRLRPRTPSCRAPRSE